MKAECRLLAERLSAAYPDDILRSRGLETPEVKRERQCTVIDIQWIVLDEQHLQLDGGRGVIQPRALAKLASTLTRKSVEEALTRATILREEVLQDLGIKESKEALHMEYTKPRKQLTDRVR